MNVWVGKIVGQPGPGLWAQVHDFTPVDEKIIRGRLVAVISLKDNESTSEIEMVAAGREILSRLHELYYAELEAPVLDQLKLAIGRVCEETLQHDMRLSMVAVVIHEDSVYVVSSGGGVWVQNQGKEGWLVDPASDPSLNAFKGKLQTDQVVVIGNQSFWQEVPVGIVRAGIANDSEAMLENLGAIVHGTGSKSACVGVVIRSLAQSPVTVSEPRPEPKSKPAVTASVVKTSWLDKIKTRLPGRQAPIYLSGERSRWGKQAMYGGIAFLAILLILVLGWRVRKQQTEKRNSLDNQAVEEVVYKFREAQALTELNPARSRELLNQVQVELDNLETSKDERILEVIEQMPAVLGAATGTKVIEPSEVLDLELVRSGMTGRVIRLYEDNLVILDTAGNRLIEVDPGRKKGEVVVGEDSLGKTQAMGVYPGKITAVSDKGIIECQTSDYKCRAVVGNGEWGDVVDMGMFGGNIYILSRGNIWRHQVTESGYSGKQDWLSEPDSNLNSTTQMTIDGSIWVAAGSNIYKYTRGVKDNFALPDLDKPLGVNFQLFASEESDKLYILDRQNGRIVVVSKTGEYDSQYISEKAKDATSFTVDEKGTSIYLLVGSKIWSIKL